MATTYKQVSELEIQVTETTDTKTVSTPLKLVDGSWQKINGKVVDLSDVEVEWLTQEDKDIAEAEAQAIASKQTRSAQKRTGVKLEGVMVSLTEDNQNGIAAVLKGIELAAEMHVSLFPLNFNATTADGTVSIPFDNVVQFKTFAIEFLFARQRFFV